MRTPFTILALFALVIACGLILLIHVATRPPPAAPSVMVGFIGYTNDATAGLLARFAVTNASPGPVIRHVFYGVQAPAAKLGRWTDVSVGSFTNQGNLRAGGSEVVFVTVPTNSPSWRLSLTVLRDEPVRMMMRSLMAEARKIGIGPQSGRSSGGYYRVTSDAINP